MTSPSAPPRKLSLFAKPIWPFSVKGVLGIATAASV
jgi:hypothetical protein